MDYSGILDAQARDFIRRAEAFYPPGAVEMSITDQRRVYDEMCRAFFRGYPPGVRVRDTSMGGVPGHIYQHGAPAFSLVYLHGVSG